MIFRYIRDPLQSTLRDVLDDVIQLHNKHVGVSIFTESVKAYVKTTVTQLIEVLLQTIFAAVTYSTPGHIKLRPVVLKIK